MKRLLCLLTACCLILFALACSDNPTDAMQQNPKEPAFLSQDYVVFAWNDLGMHCLNAYYDSLVVLPPYNNLWAQIVRRGDPPQIVTSGITVQFEIKNNTSSADKRTYGQFWDNAVDLFGTLFGISSLPIDVGLTGTGLSGEMELEADHFVAGGIPVVPVSDSDNWNPYQVALIMVKNASGDTIAVTRCTLPTSDEMNCAKCHGPSYDTDILSEHDEEHMTDHLSSVPVLCADCHGSPAYGQLEEGLSGKFLSEAIHGAHSDRSASCYDCHPGAVTQCSRSMEHAAADGNCTTCHGGLAEVASTIDAGRVPWAEEPACADCHSSGIPEVVTGQTLYRNAMGHGNIYCAACHGSPHAMVPAREPIDNYQAIQYNAAIRASSLKTIASCGTCHGTSHPALDEVDDFLEMHGGIQPEQFIGCHACHTVVVYDTDSWPHHFQWTDSN